MLWQPGRFQGPDEDGSERDPRRPCELPAGSSGAWRGAQIHQPPQAHPSHRLRNLQYHCAHLRDVGECSADFIMTQQQF